MNVGMQGGPFKKISQLLQNKGVHEELGLTDVQKTDLNTALGEIRKNLMPEVKKLQTLSEEERTQSRPEILTKLNDELDAALNGVLAAEQFKRFKEINARSKGVNFFADNEIKAELALSDEQVENMRTVLNDLMEQAKSIRQSQKSNPQEGRKELAELRKQAMEKVTDEFTDEQKTQWAEMIGEDFELKLQPTGGPGMGRPGMGGQGMGRPGMGGPGMGGEGGDTTDFDPFSMDEEY